MMSKGHFCNPYVNNLVINMPLNLDPNIWCQQHECNILYVSGFKHLVSTFVFHGTNSSIWVLKQQFFFFLSFWVNCFPDVFHISSLCI